MIRKMKETLAQAFAKILPAGTTAEITVPDHEKLGHYSTNIAFRLAKETGANPTAAAETLAAKLREQKIPGVAAVKIADGYINFFLSPEYLNRRLREIARDKKFGRSRIGQGQTVIVEYSQPNIAKKLHAGHLRTTIIGAALANLHEWLGYRVIRWNYLGDWGTQFGKVMAAYKLWGDAAAVKTSPVRTLLDLYIRFNREAENNPELEARGQAEFKKLEDGDGENLKLWRWFRDESIRDLKKIYRRLGVSFDVWIGESFFNEEVGKIAKDLETRGFARRSEGALIVDLEKENRPPALIQKSDGASLYLTRDIANLAYRLKKYRPAKILYVVGNEQALHFEQLFLVAKIIGLPAAEYRHIKYGLVLGEDGKKLSTRAGKIVSLEGLLDEVVAAARQVVEEKNPGLSAQEKAAIAETVGLGALKYNDLKENRLSDIKFDIKKMLDFRGDSAPYLQYTYARFASILAKGKMGWWRRNDFLLTEPVELSLIKKIMDFPEAVRRSGETCLTSQLALHLYELANLANRLYETLPVLKDEKKPRREARLLLIGTVNQVLKKGLGLLGIETAEKI